MYTSDTEPNIPGAIGMLFLVAIAGALLVNLLLARHVLSPDSLLTLFSEMGTKSLIENRLADSEWPVDDLENKAKLVANSPEIEALVRQHGTYVTHFLLTSEEKNRVTEQDLEQALLPHLRSWSTDPNVTDEKLLAQTQKLIQQTNLMTVFPSAKSYLPGKLAARFQLVLNQTLLLSMVAALLLFALMLLLACRLKLFLLFLGLSTIMTGIFAFLIGKLAAILMEVLFSNSLLLLILTTYRNELARAQNLLLIAGGIGVLLGIAMLIFLRIRRNNQIGLQRV